MIEDIKEKINKSKEIHRYNITFSREWFENLLTYITNLQQENKQLKEEKKKAIEWVKQHISKYNCRGITIIDWDELSNPNDLLEILGDKE